MREANKEGKKMANKDFLATCTRCGQGINNICRFENKAYGTECILHVTGDQELLNHIYAIRRKGRWQFDADEWLKKQDERKRKEKEEKTERENKEKQIQLDNAWIIEVLQSELDCRYVRTRKDGSIQYTIDMTFIESMLHKMKHNRFVDCSERVQNILIDIYAVRFGRRNSKNYKRAVAEAEGKAYPKERVD